MSISTSDGAGGVGVLGINFNFQVSEMQQKCGKVREALSTFGQVVMLLDHSSLFWPRRLDTKMLKKMRSRFVLINLQSCEENFANQAANLCYI